MTEMHFPGKGGIGLVFPGAVRYNACLEDIQFRKGRRYIKNEQRNSSSVIKEI